MDSQKIGTFLRELRKEKNLTQEQLAEILGVSGRTVSRWETGSNMPDLAIMIELADYYDIDIKELLNGERKSEMDKELKETLKTVADYTDIQKIDRKREQIPQKDRFVPKKQRFSEQTLFFYLEETDKCEFSSF